MATTSVILPGWAQKRLANYSPWGQRESDKTKRLSSSILVSSRSTSQCEESSDTFDYKEERKKEWDCGNECVLLLANVWNSCKYFMLFLFLLRVIGWMIHHIIHEFLNSAFLLKCISIILKMFFVQFKHLGKLCWVLFSSWLYFGKLSMERVSMSGDGGDYCTKSDLWQQLHFSKDCRRSVTDQKGTSSYWFSPAHSDIVSVLT